MAETGWELWRTALAVARSGTLAGAAAAIGIDATTAGRRVRRLERELGKTLLRRSGASLLPTEACLDLMPKLDAADALLREAGDVAGSAGPARTWRMVRITSVTTICDDLLAPAVPHLVANRPNLGVELIADNRNLSLPRREADVALRLGPLGVEPDGARLIGSLTYAAYVSREAEPSASRLPWAALDGALAHLPEMRALAAAGGRMPPRYRANRMETLRALVAAGLARAVLPCITATRDPGLVRIEDGPSLQRPVYVITDPNDGVTTGVASVVAWIETLFATQET